MAAEEAEAEARAAAEGPPRVRRAAGRRWPEPGCPARAAFGEIEALASCFKRSGDDWISSGRVRVNGLDIVPLLHTDVVVNPSERTVSTRGLARVFAGESLLFEGSVSWKFDGGRVEFEAARAGAIHALPILGQVGRVTAGPGAFRVTLYPRLDPIFNEFFHQFLFAAGEHIPLRVPTGTGDLTLRSENASGVRFDGIRVDMSSLAVGEVRAQATPPVVRRRYEWMGRGVVHRPAGA